MPTKAKYVDYECAAHVYENCRRTWKVSIMNEENVDDASAELINDMAEDLAKLLEFYCLTKGTFNYRDMVVTVEKTLIKVSEDN